MHLYGLANKICSHPLNKQSFYPYQRDEVIEFLIKNIQDEPKGQMYEIGGYKVLNKLLDIITQIDYRSQRTAEIDPAILVQIYPRKFFPKTLTPTWLENGGLKLAVTHGNYESRIAMSYVIGNSKELWSVFLNMFKGFEREYLVNAIKTAVIVQKYVLNGNDEHGRSLLENFYDYILMRYLSEAAAFQIYDRKEVHYYPMASFLAGNVSYLKKFKEKIFQGLRGKQQKAVAHLLKGLDLKNEPEFREECLDKLLEHKSMECTSAALNFFARYPDLRYKLGISIENIENNYIFFMSDPMITDELTYLDLSFSEITPLLKLYPNSPAWVILLNDHLDHKEVIEWYKTQLNGKNDDYILKYLIVDTKNVCALIPSIIERLGKSDDAPLAVCRLFPYHDLSKYESELVSISIANFNTPIYKGLLLNTIKYSKTPSKYKTKVKPLLSQYTLQSSMILRILLGISEELYLVGPQAPTTPHPTNIQSFK